jgi:ankyrin repeat protein
LVLLHFDSNLDVKEKEKRLEALRMADVNVKDKEGKCLLMKVARERGLSVEAFKKIASKTSKENLEEKDKDGLTPLTWVMVNQCGKKQLEVSGGIEKMIVLLKYGAEPIVYYHNIIPMHIIFRVVQEFEREVVQALLKFKGSYATEVLHNNYGNGTTIWNAGASSTKWTPLHVGAACNRGEIVEDLIRAGANVNATSIFKDDNGSILRTGKGATDLDAYDLTVLLEKYGTAHILTKYYP